MHFRTTLLATSLLATGCAAGAPPPAFLPASASPAPAVPSGFISNATPAPTATPQAASAPPSVAPSLPPLSPFQLTCASPAAGVTVAVEPRDASGLPLPGALALGARVDALALLRGRASRKLLGDSAAAFGGDPTVYELGDVTAVVTVSYGGETLENGVAVRPLRLAGARITAPGGLTTEAARAWLRAIAPCAAIPDLGSLGEDWRPELGSVDPPENVGHMGDTLDLLAARTAGGTWDIYTRTMLGERFNEPSTRVLPMQGEVPKDRWAGVIGFGVGYGNRHFSC